MYILNKKLIKIKSEKVALSCRLFKTYILTANHLCINLERNTSNLLFLISLTNKFLIIFFTTWLSNRYNFSGTSFCVFSMMRWVFVFLFMSFFLRTLIKRLSFRHHFGNKFFVDRTLTLLLDIFYFI